MPVADPLEGSPTAPLRINRDKGTLMAIRCQKIRMAAETMELDLYVDSADDHRFATDKMRDWGYQVVAVRGGGVAIPNLITVTLGGRDDEGIIDKMCNQPEFDVKC